MMEIVVRGHPKNVTKKQVHGLAVWSARELGLHRFRRPNLYIDIHLKKSFYLKTGFWGVCGWEDDYVRPREFAIEIERNLSYNNLMSSVIHELVHVKQFAQERLKDRTPHYIFEGKTYSPPDVNYVASKRKNYWDQPWEKEAVALEISLFKKFLKGKFFRKGVF